MKATVGTFPIEVRDGDQRRHRSRIMTDVAARDGDIVEPLGMKVENYLKNPVVMWIHDYVGRTPSAGLPIGRTLSLKRQPRGIDVEFEFLPGDAFASRVANAWEKGFLRTASIGWESLEATPLPNGRGLRHRKSDLLEWSLVPIPADPGASRELFTAGMRSLGYGDLLGDVPTGVEDARFIGASSREPRPETLRVDHPPLTQLVAELEDAWDYLKARLGPAGPTSPRLEQSLARLASDLNEMLAVPVGPGPNNDMRGNGDDTADLIGPDALLRAAEEFQGLVEEMRQYPDAHELRQALESVLGSSK